MAIEIKSRLEPFWDDYLLNTEETTAKLQKFSPVKREKLFECGEAWEGDGCDYYNMFCDDGLYRMYYLAWRMSDHVGDTGSAGDAQIRVCYAESRDGIHWVKPNLGLRECCGSKDNNIILDKTDQKFDNFYVFKDTNPNCPPEAKYKAVTGDHGAFGKYLKAYYSPDGIHFTAQHVISTSDFYDTLNIAFYDPRIEMYVAYVRGFHGGGFGVGVRDIRRLTSPDFINWSESEQITFNDDLDIALYTNAVSIYPRAPHIYTGFPTRYIERKQWTSNYDRLCGRERRLERFQQHPRYGLTVTDCIFMSSRDGKHWTRYNDPFMRPGPENGRNWVYGDCYPCVGMYETASADRGADTELSMLMGENHWHGIPTEIYRYTIRKDGFAGIHADWHGQTAVTKELVFEGNTMVLNFATSARGGLYVTIIDADGNKLESGELFGDSTERIVDFDGDLTAFSGKPVTIRFDMMECDLFSMQFVNQK